MRTPPGELSTDLLNNPRADDPAVNNTGTGIGYSDRGAVEVLPPIGDGGEALIAKPGGLPQDAVAVASLTSSWTTSGSIGTFSYQFDDSPYPVVTTATSVEHHFRTAGGHCVLISASTDAFRTGLGSRGWSCVVLGADAVPPRQLPAPGPTYCCRTRIPVTAPQPS